MIGRHQGTNFLSAALVLLEELANMMTRDVGRRLCRL